MQKTSYPKARAKMVQREKVLTQALRRRFGRVLKDVDMDMNAFVDMCVNACLQAADYAKAKGFEVFKNDLEKVRMDWAFGLESNGKTFNHRLFTLVSLDKIRVLLPRDNPQEVFHIIKDASHSVRSKVDMLARNCGWLEHADAKHPGAKKDWSKQKFQEAWQQSNDPLHIPLVELRSRELELVQQLEFKFLGKVSAEDVFTAAQNAKRYAHKRGFNGWLYKTEQLRKKYAPIATTDQMAKNPSFTAAIYRVAALEIVIEMRHLNPEVLIFFACSGDVGAVASWAELCGFMRKYESPEENARRRWAEEQAKREQANEWFWEQFRRNFGFNSERSSPLDIRDDEWAYQRESAIPVGVSWYVVLDVDKNSSLADVKSAYRKMSLKVHPDVLQKDQVVKFSFETVAAAWRVAQKVLGEK